MKPKYTINISAVAKKVRPKQFTPFNLPRVWDINANGFIGSLVINTINAAGNFTGTVFGNRMFGLFDSVTQKISFNRVINAADPESIQTYTGYVFSLQNPRMAGVFQAFRTGGGTPTRQQFGWFATRRIVIGAKKKK